MSRKIKFHTFHFLFRLFAYLADKTGGWRVFVRPKLLLGSLIMGLGLTGTGLIEAQNKAPQKSQSKINSIKANSKDSVKSDDDQTMYYTVIESMPQFPGGESALLSFIQKNLTKLPITQCYNGIPGKVICRFVVEKDGSVSNITVIRSLDPACDKEAVRVLKLLPKFTPGKQNGQAVRVYYTLPVIFKLE
jgi:TonB family protein